MTSITVKDAGAGTHTLGTSTPSSGPPSGKEFGGHFNQAVADGGASVYRSLDVQPTGQVVKNAGGTLYGGLVFNGAFATPSGSWDRYLKIYDKATAATAGDTPLITIPLEAGVETPLRIPPCGILFVNGISIRCTTGLADADTGAPGTNDVVVNLFYA